MVLHFERRATPVALKDFGNSDERSARRAPVFVVRHMAFARLDPLKFVFTDVRFVSRLTAPSSMRLIENSDQPPANAAVVPHGTAPKNLDLAFTPAFPLAFTR